MSDPQFAGQGEALLTEPLRAFRSWSVTIKISPQNFSIRDYLDSRVAARASDPDQDRVQLHRDLWKAWGRSGGPLDLGVPVIREEPWPRPLHVEGTPVPGTNDVITHVVITPVNHSSHGPWTDRTTHGECGEHAFLPDHVPGDDCTCGIYSWYRHPDAVREHTSVLTGVVNVGGRVLLGSRGIRSSQATIEALTVNDRMEHLLPVDSPTLLDALRRRAEDPHDPMHGIKIFSTVKQLNRAYPPDLDTLRNLLGQRFIDDLEYGGGHPWLSLGSAANGVHLMAGQRAQCYLDRVNTALGCARTLAKRGRIQSGTATTPTPTLAFDPPEDDTP